MATTPTNLPVSSETPRDLKFNAGKIDEFVTSLVNTYIDRFGNEHYTIEGLRWLAQQAIAQYGWIPVGTFQAGATLTLPNQILKDTTDGEYYRWDGSFLPSGKVVPNGSTPGTTGGVGVGAWISVGDSTIRALLASENGASQIGTSHRGLLSSDLNAIDRRPDGYGGDPAAVLANGQDVEINTDLDITGPLTPNDYQIIRGTGGQLKNTMNGTPTGRAISIIGKNGVKVRDVRALGKIINGNTTDGNVSYCLHAEDCTNLDVDGIESSGYTGTVELTRVEHFTIRRVFSRANRYHPNVVAGGYGIVMSAKFGVIEGLNFEADASKGDLGRHSAYFSARGTQAEGSTEFCENVTIIGLVARYFNIDNRDMPAVVIRRSKRCAVRDFLIDGANGGFGFNADNGVIEDFQISDGHLKIIQPVDNIAVSCVGGGKDNDDTLFIGLKVDNVTMEMEGKAGVTITTYRTHPINLTGRQCSFTNLRFKVRGDVNPILVGATSRDWIIDGVKDSITFGEPTAALIRFQGSNSNIKVFNLDTARPPFIGLDNVTDLTVNWERFARIVSSSGTVTTTDSNSLISSVTATRTGEITVVFKNHVTQNAVRNCTVTSASVGGLVILPEITGRNLVLRFYNGSGTLVPLSTSIVSADIRLHS